MKLIGGNISDTPIKDISDGSAFSVGGGGVGLPGDPLWSNVKLLVQPHSGDVGVDGLHDRGPDGRTATIGSGSVTITDDYGRSPIYGAYADPSSASVTYSDDAGLQFGTGDFCFEIIVNRQSPGGICGHGLFTGNSPGTRHFQAFMTDASFYWYRRPGGSVFSSFEPGAGYDTTNGPMVENVTFDRSSGTIRMFWNGTQCFSDTDSIDYDTNWAAFKLFTDGSETFSGNMIALRFTHASRYTAEYNAPLVGFPEAAA